MDTHRQSATRVIHPDRQALKGGQVQFRAEKNGIVHAGIGKVSFTDEALLENLRAFMLTLSRVKPEGQKGKYIQVMCLASSRLRIKRLTILAHTGGPSLFDHGPKRRIGPCCN